MRFLRRPFSQQALLVEALLWLALARVVVAWVPFRIYSRWLGRMDQDCSTQSQCSALSQQVGWAVSLGANLLPGRCACLPPALAARAMLQRRGATSTLYLGTSREQGLRAHAWLRCGDVIVTGAAGRERFAVVARFNTP